MRFQLDITLTDEDYLEFNDFHSFKSTSGKKLIRKTRLTFIAVMVLLMVLVLMMGRTTFWILYAAFLGLFTLLFMLYFHKLIKKNIKKQIEQMKKTGKLPYDAVSRLEFYDDKLVEISTGKRIEQSYDALERICVDADRYIYLYYSSVSAYILPVPQIRAQLDQAQLLGFLSQKTDAVEYYG